MTTDEEKNAKLAIAMTYAMGALSDISDDPSEKMSFAGKTAKNALGRINALLGVEEKK